MAISPTFCRCANAHWVRLIPLEIGSTLRWRLMDYNHGPAYRRFRGMGASQPVAGRYMMSDAGLSSLFQAFHRIASTFIAKLAIVMACEKLF